MAEVNLDVAMQSTSEEILEKVKISSEAEKAYPDLFVEGIPAAAGTYTLVDVTGKGKLFFAVCYQGMHSSYGAFSLKIEIDGEVFFYNTLTLTVSSSYDGWIAVAPIDYIKCVSVNSNTRQFHVAGVPSTSANNTYSSNLYFVKKGVANTQKDVGATVVSPINQYVSFNESLKITAVFTNPNNIAREYRVGYSLDE